MKINSKNKQHGPICDLCGRPTKLTVKLPNGKPMSICDECFDGKFLKLIRKVGFQLTSGR